MSIPILNRRELAKQIASTEPEEVLVIDARSSLTPVQMVEQKLLALLGSGHPGLFRQAAGRQGNLRMRGQ